MRASSILSSLPIALLFIPPVLALPPAQIPLPPIAMPSPPPPPPQTTGIASQPPPPSQIQHSVSLADILGTHRALTTFHSLARQTRALEDLLAASTPPPAAADSTHDPSQRYAAALAAAGSALVVLAPPNAAVEKMPHKPWESPADYASHGAAAYAGPAGRARADDNVRRFVETHVVAVVPAGAGDGGWPEGARAETLAGRAVWWETRGGARVVMPDGVEVERVASRVSNGELWILKGVLGGAA